MEKINLPIDPEIGAEIKKHIDAGLVITGLGMLKGWKNAPDTYFLSIDVPGPAGALVSASPASLATVVVVGKKLGDGDPEKLEKGEPMPPKMISVTHSPDPSKPTLADMVDRIVSTHRQLEKSGKILAEACVSDILEMKDPVTKIALPTEVINACQMYLNQVLR